ncbi:MAG TPA: D-alanyl-D-alanine carboxypeptidase family protein [Solirubrobacteraceae bacterium]|nr:D-alanyl-D-alanine carboxypeptidase family protein [Solirubrobacteraceae bacterium]
MAILAVALSTCVAAASARSSRKQTPPPAVQVALPAPTLPVTGASLLLAGTKTPLWSSHGNAELPIASTTKLMTALVVLQHVTNLNTVFTQNDWDPAAADSQIGLIPGERMTVHDLLVALLLPSADDAAEDLAYNVGGGSIARFVAMMNADARSLGLTRTHYTTPIGLDTPGNYSSPDDLVRLADYMMSNWPFFRQTVGLSSAVLTSGRYVRHIVNTDDLVGKIGWIHGVKTGHTADAGYVLVSEGSRDGFTLLASVLGTASEADRDASALALLNWGFSEFKLVRPVRRAERFALRPVPYEAARVSIVAARGYSTVAARNARIKLSVGKLRELHGPMAKGTIVGHLRVTIAGRHAVRIPLILARRLPPVSMLTKLGHFLRQPFTLLVLALLLASAGVAFRGWRRRPRVVALRRVEER